MTRDYFFNFDKLDYVQGNRSSECVLCQLCKKSKAFPDLSVYETKYLHVSINLFPYNPGHLMIFPKRHITDVREYSQEEWLDLQNVQNKVLNAIEECYNPTGFNAGYNLGEDSGASIAHIHLHIIPRFPRELGISEILAGKRLLVEDPFVSKEKISKILNKN